jgi:hypothetical protein
MVMVMAKLIVTALWPEYWTMPWRAFRVAAQSRSYRASRRVLVSEVR